MSMVVVMVMVGGRRAAMKMVMAMAMEWGTAKSTRKAAGASKINIIPNQASRRWWQKAMALTTAMEMKMEMQMVEEKDGEEQEDEVRRRTRTR